MQGKLKILMLEDVEEDALLADRAMQREKMIFTRIRVDTRSEFTAALNDFHPDVILSDHALPQFNSIDALEICKRRKPQIPFILVTGAVSEEFAVNCLKRGANDYILKTNLSRLPMAIKYAIRQHKYESERIRNEEMLRQQNDELSKINKELDSFVYSVSHNLRSPLSSVLGLVNIARLDREKGPETTDQYFRMIETSVLKLDKTLHEILDYSQNARTEVERREVDLDDLVTQCFEQQKYIPGFSEVDKSVEILQDVPFYSDAHRLSIILNNLIANAIRYRDLSKSSQFLKIVLKVESESATFNLLDNGIGIDEEHLPQIFNMFFRATERSDGAGLGLYIVKEMISRLKGTIAISSTPFLETLVTFTIPNTQCRGKVAG
ncbi:MAG TPA: hybrid sensor histidine kinase/response regulator [Chryseolinea sp.]|nr:hybrid sensor histidine kinase/response regulator [Chryseolinea sp.]